MTPNFPLTDEGLSAHADKHSPAIETQAIAALLTHLKQIEEIWGHQAHAVLITMPMDANQRPAFHSVANSFNESPEAMLELGTLLIQRAMALATKQIMAQDRIRVN